jgi:outer membrane murein-binding lipoprotein Lpp
MAIGVMLTSLLVAGCASDLTLGDAIKNESAGLAKVGADWTRGDKLVSEGRSDVEEGKDLIARGRERIENGEDKISEGKRIRAQAERDYRKQTGKDLPDL